MWRLDRISIARELLLGKWGDVIHGGRAVLRKK